MKSSKTLKVMLLCLVFGVLFVVTGSFGASGFARDGAGLAEKKAGEILVKFKAGVNSSQAESVHSRLGGKILEKVQRISVHRVKIPEDADIAEEIREYEQDPRVEYAEPNYKRRALIIPNDTYYASYQWNMPKIKAPEAWEAEKGSSSVTIAIVDTGASLSHPDLNDKLVAGRDYYGDPPFYLPDNDPSDENGHGTYVAGIAAAETNNAQGVAGVSWYSRIMPVRVLGPNGEGWDSDIANGIIWAADNGAKIINMSLGGPDYSATILNAINYAYSRGCVLIAASGNLGDQGNPIVYPAAYDHVIGVGATNSSDQRPSFSNYGYYVDVAAPGEDIFSTYWNSGSNGYASGSGTSAASPHVAGLAALLASYYPTWTNDQIEQRIESSADDLGSPGRDDYYGYGRINCFSTFVTNYPNGALIKTSSSPNVYLLEGGIRRWITSPTSFSSNGLRWDRIVTIIDPVMNSYSLGTSLKARPGTLLKGSAPNIYVTDLVGGVYQRRWITSPAVFASLGLRWEDIIEVSDSELLSYTPGSDVDSAPLYLNGTLIADTSGKVYLLEEGKKRWITSPATFNSYGFRWDRIISLPSYQIEAYSEGDSLKARPGTLIKGSGPNVYVTDLAGSIYQRRWITSADIFVALRYHWEDIFAISDSELFSYTEGPNVSL